MSEGSTTIEETKGMEMEPEVKTWQVNYNATYWVRASSEDEAIDLAMELHADLPDGSWEGFIDPYDSENYNTLGEK